MLGFKEFCNEIREGLPECLMEYDIEEVRLNTVAKNNGRELTAVTIAVSGENVSPNIYLESYYLMYTEGMSFEQVLESVRDDYIQARADVPAFDETEIVNRDRLYVQIVNYERNMGRLENIPHEKFLDMAVTTRMLIRNDDYGVASAVVDYKMMEQLNMTKEELLVYAKENSVRLFPVKIQRLEDSIMELTSEELPPTGIYVLTNNAGVNGASCMLYDGILKEAAMKMGEQKFRVLPSSVHEVLLVSENCMEPEELQEMVAAINRSTVSETEYLSDSVYEYDAGKDSLSIAVDGKDTYRAEERY